MFFDPQTALNYAASISRPRRVGSGEDERVAHEIEERLRQWGYHVERQPFAFSTAPSAFLTLVVLSGMLLVVIMLLMHDRRPLIADAAALLLMLIVLAFLPLNRWMQLAAVSDSRIGAVKGRLLKRHQTANLIARLPLPERPDVPHLFLVAHYDSKSQHMPLAVRITLFMMTIIFGLILAVLTPLNVSSVIYLPIGFLALATGIPLLFLDVGNNSPGAIDNASGAGLVLHLAEGLLARDDWRDKLRITLLIPSAEELTLMGSVAYVAAHAQYLRRQAKLGGLCVLNFDGIGVDGDLYYVGNSPHLNKDTTIDLLEHVRRACHELHLPLKRFGVVGALFDHMPFAQRGFDAISLIAVGAASRSVHTPQDSIDKLHRRGFEQAGQVALRVIEQLIGGNP